MSDADSETEFDIPESIEQLEEYGGDWDGNLPLAIAKTTDPVASLRGAHIELQHRADAVHDRIEAMEDAENIDFEKSTLGSDYEQGRLDGLRTAAILVGEASLRHEQRRRGLAEEEES